MRLITAKRGAPTVAALNKAAARKNIESKIHAIETVLALVPPSLTAMSSLPPSVRQFNMWMAKRGSLAESLDGTVVPVVDLMRNARQTLMDDSLLSERVKVAIARSAAAADGRRLSGKRAANLEARLAFAESLRKASELALCNMHDKVNTFQIALVKERTKFKELSVKFNKELSLRDEEIQLERDRVGQLTAQIRDLSKFNKLK